MADFVAVLKKTIGGLDEANADVRQKVYDKARTTIAAKLGQMNPPPPAAIAERQKKALEDAIRAVEAEYGGDRGGSQEPADELEAIFASLSSPEPKASPRPLEPAAPPPPPQSAPRERAFPEPAALANRPPEHSSVTMPSALSGAQKPSGAPLAAPHRPAAATSATVDETSRKQPADPDSFFLEPGEDTFSGEIAPPMPGRRRGAGLLVALLALIVIAGAAYGAWFKRGDIASALGVQLPEFARTGQPAPKKIATTVEPAPAKKTEAANKAGQKPATPPSAEGAAKDGKPPVDVPATATKFTQRLAADGTESNPGPAAGEVKIGEGTSVAAATSAENKTPAGENAPSQPAPGADTARVPVAQRAIFYEKRTNTEQGSANTGTVVWSMVKESPGGDLPPEPAIRGEATIPSKNLQLRITIRRNGDKTLPASHIVELIFLTPDNFDGGGIDSVLRMAMKSTEQAAGSPVIGIPAKIADGYFLLALNDGKAEIETNTTLLRRAGWIDIPVVYKSGRQALMTLEKGIPGDKVFDDVLSAWQQTPIGQEGTPAPAGDNGGGDGNKPAPANGSNG
ncbi:MAG: hypothetical protein L0I29_17070 [Hyphomicrobiales bacterium]|nr:hypothetical protein [Hyphomicrobiales bacterium]